MSPRRASTSSCFGWTIAGRIDSRVQPLTRDVEDKTKQVNAAMNEINAAQREQVAASARGEAETILKVKQAEAEAESKALQGQGIANQRKAIIEGLKQSVEAKPFSPRSREPSPRT